MKLSKKLEKEVLQVYDAYWSSYLAGDIKTFSTLIHDDLWLTGTSEREVFYSKKEIIDFLKKGVDEFLGKVSLRNKEIKLMQVNDLVLVSEHVDLYVLIDEQWNFYSRVRLSTWLIKTEDGWKIINQHGSFPDSKTQGEETLAFEKIKSENLELRDAVKRRTIELENKNHELEIEASLERVRSQALVMQKPDDLPGICEILFGELRDLGFRELRNAMINIYDDSCRSFLNYDYSDVIGRSITQLFYDTHPIIANQVKQIRSSSDAFSETIFTGNELVEWREFRKEKGEKDDPRLENISSLYYYFYSIGSASIGISTFGAISEEKLNVLKRFRNVFDFAYRRYLDVASAMAQAKEVQIELALERVRARTMAMQRSEELSETAYLMLQQFTELGQEPEQITIGVVNEEDFTIELSITLHGKMLKETLKGSLHEPVVLSKIYKAWKEGMKTFVLDISGKELQEYNRYRNSLRHSDDFDISTEQRRVIHVVFFSKGIISLATPEPRPPEIIRLLERFAGVFELTYTRFLDLKKAETQAQKANIEAAMERVRARALAMTEPEEILEIAELLRNEMGVLGVEEIETGTIFIFDETTDTAQFGFTAKDIFHPEKKAVTDTVTIDLKKTWAGVEFLNYFKSERIQSSIRMESANRKEWIEYIYSVSPKVNNIFGDNIEDKTYHMYKFSNGAIGAAATGDISEDTWNLLKTAASVFSLAYSRFKDLSKARIDLQNLIDEKKRSDSLLLNILPEDIASELKQFGKSYARKHEEVTILFADIKGFSTIAENLSADELVTQLDECFRAFDKIVEKHGLEKIKTVGDAYLCACGLPKPVPDNGTKTVRAALDMIDFLKGFGISKKVQNLPAFEFRVGIHTGPVVTGVVGLKKFTYDIWGDAVNMAARMEQHGEEGKINISGSTYEKIKDKFKCTYRGKIEAKNKGQVDMYFVEGVL